MRKRVVIFEDGKISHNGERPGKKREPITLEQRKEKRVRKDIFQSYRDKYPERCSPIREEERD